MDRISLGGNPREVHLIFQRNADAILQCHFEDENGMAINLTGSTLKLSLKKSYNSTTSLSMTITPITLATGDVDIVLTAAQTVHQTSGIYDLPDAGDYDLFLTDSGSVRQKLMYGSFETKKSISY